MKKYSESRKQIELAGRMVEYTHIRSDRKTLSVGIEGTDVVVKSPLFVSDAEVKRFLLQRRHWILVHLDAALKREEKIRNQLPSVGYSDPLKQRLENHYREQARSEITKLVDYYTAVLGVSYRSITIRDQKTRWGSCSAKGGLNFRWRLILAPPKVLEYVVIHEVCHLLHMDHSPAFWREVEQLMPDYRLHRTWLRKYGPLLSESYEPIR